LEFPRLAQREGFQAAVQHVSGLCRRSPQPVEEIPGAVCFDLPIQARAAILRSEGEDDWDAEWDAREQISDEIGQSALDFCLERGCHLVRSRFRDDGYALVLLPTPDKYAVIAAFGTRAGNHGLDTPAIMAWLREMERQQPFVLTGCADDTIEGRFTSTVHDPEVLARRMEAFCPDLVGQVVDSLEEVVELLAERRFHFWWD
jgi:hypothetical protein